MKYSQWIKTLLTALSLASATWAASYVSPPMGCFPVELRAASDNAIGIPLERPAVFAGRIQSTEANVVSLNNETPWTSDCWAGSGETGEFFFLQIVSGTLKGATFPILSNGANSLVIAPDGEDLALLQSDSAADTGDLVRILPYWTPDEVFCQSGYEVGISIVLFDADAPVENAVPTAVLTYDETEGWMDQDGNWAGNYPLRPDRGFFVRLAESSQDGCLNIVGCVPLLPERHIFNAARATSGGDMLFALNHPEPIGLTSAGFEFADRTMVFTYDQSRRFDRDPSAVYTYYEDYGWVDQRFQPVGGDEFLEPGKAYFVRIPQRDSVDAWVWTREPAYLERL